MSVKIRLKRMGKKRAAQHRIVVADSRSPRDGRFIEEVGYYDPNHEPNIVKFDEEKVSKWLSTGAQPTEIVSRLLKNAGLAEGKTAAPKKVAEVASEAVEDVKAEVEETVAEAEEATEA